MSYEKSNLAVVDDWTLEDNARLDEIIIYLLGVGILMNIRDLIVIYNALLAHLEMRGCLIANASRMVALCEYITM